MPKPSIGRKRDFKETLERGLREYEKVTRRLRQEGQTRIPAAEAFDLYETYGLPLSLTAELAGEQGLTVDEAGFEALYEAHKDASRQVTDTKVQRRPGG